MSIHKEGDRTYKIRWREGGRNRSLRVHGSHELAKSILHKKLALRAENRHLDIRREINFRMATLVDRYWDEYGSRKKSHDRERAIVQGIRDALGQFFVREVDGTAIDRWYRSLTDEQGLAPGTAVRHFTVMHHMMKKASTIWSKETGIDRNPADLVEISRPDDQRERYLGKEEMHRLKKCLDQKRYRKNSAYRSGYGSEINRTFYRLRLIVLIALTTGMRMAEILGLRWSDLFYSEEVIAVRAKLKRGKVRYVPLSPELAREFRSYPATAGEDRIFPPKLRAKGERQRVERSFRTVLRMAGIENFRFHDLRHTFASWYMMNGGDLYELAKILGHANIRMTERYAKLAKSHLARTGSTARELWKMLVGQDGETVLASA
ncbi:MAG: site-specific integrase [Acidobacteriota bacterium]|nr:site-specific integrase [Acidobacteriota bacterium]